MKPTKFIWIKSDRFNTIREKAVALVGLKVVNKDNEKLPYTIFSVSEVEETVLDCIGTGFIKFLAGDMNYVDGQGGYNFKDSGKVNMWGFSITYGLEDASGRRIEQTYNLMIPRKYGYEEDLKKCGIVVDENHPFIFYRLKTK